MKNNIIYEFGNFPLLSKSYREIFPSGKIILKKGEHRGNHLGFGARHILAEHNLELKRKGFENNEQGIIEYINQILRRGAKILSEFENTRGNHRPLIVYSTQGTVVLQRQNFNGSTVYSIVTAFPRTNPIGIQIGSMP